MCIRDRSYAFNHAEAARSFYYASQLDSACAMCYWGFAYVLGPNYNGGMEPDSYQRAFNAIETAKKWVKENNTKEKDLIYALATRYTADPVENRAPLDSTYSCLLYTSTRMDRYQNKIDKPGQYTAQAIQCCLRC